MFVHGWSRGGFRLIATFTNIKPRDLFRVDIERVPLTELLFVYRLLLLLLCFCLRMHDKNIIARENDVVAPLRSAEKIDESSTKGAVADA